jgi:hypothetical protein
MEAIGYLKSLGGSSTASFSILPTTVSADDLDPWMGL